MILEFEKVDNGYIVKTLINDYGENETTKTVVFKTLEEMAIYTANLFKEMYYVAEPVAEPVEEKL